MLLIRRKNLPLTPSEQPFECPIDANDNAIADSRTCPLTVHCKVRLHEPLQTPQLLRLLVVEDEAGEVVEVGVGYRIQRAVKLKWTDLPAKSRRGPRHMRPQMRPSQ